MSTPYQEPSTSIFLKCETCKHKVMFSAKCKCELYFCDKHRFSHNCSFSHFMHNKERLEKQNPKIESCKIVKL